MRMAKEERIQQERSEIEVNLSENNSKGAFQVMKDLTQQRQSRVSTVQDKQGNGLTDEQEIIGRWTEYCSELYNHPINEDSGVLTCHDQQMTMIAPFYVK